MCQAAARMCMRWCKQEFALRNFCFETSNPSKIVTSQWPKMPKCSYIAWRVVAAVYHVIWCILSGTQTLHMYDDGHQEKWFIYLTNWQYALVTIALLVQAVTVVVCHAKKSLLENGQMTWYLRLTWILDTMCNDVALCVGLAFWILLYSPSKGTNEVDVHTHGVTLLYLAINICITGIPTRTYHFIYAVAFGVVYLIFTVVYYAAGGLNPKGRTYIYPNVLDWSKPQTSALYICLVCIVALPVCHFIVYGLYLIRVSIYNGGCCKSDEETMNDHFELHS